MDHHVDDPFGAAPFDAEKIKRHLQKQNSLKSISSIDPIQPQSMPSLPPPPASSFTSSSTVSSSSVGQCPPPCVARHEREFVSQYCESISLPPPRPSFGCLNLAFKGYDFNINHMESGQSSSACVVPNSARTKQNAFDSFSSSCSSAIATISSSDSLANHQHRIQRRCPNPVWF